MNFHFCLKCHFKIYYRSSCVCILRICVTLMSAFSYPRIPSALKKKWPTNCLHLCCINALCRHINSKTNAAHANGHQSAPIGVYIPLETQKEIAYTQTTFSHCSQMHWCWKKSKN